MDDTLKEVYAKMKEANLQEVLSVLADSGWKVELHSCFYY